MIHGTHPFEGDTNSSGQDIRFEIGKAGACDKAAVSYPTALKSY